MICPALRSFAAEQLARYQQLEQQPGRIDPRQPTPDGRVHVCLVDGAVWWRSSAAEAKRHTTRPEFVDRLVGTLQLFFQLGPHGRHAHALPDGCASVSIEDVAFDGGGGGGGGGPALSSHVLHKDGAALPPGVFLWPEFDYEGRLASFQPPLAFVQRAAWRTPVPWALRNSTVYSRASLNIYHERRRVQKCMSGGYANSARAATGFREGRFHVGSMQWRKREGGTTCSADAPSNLPSNSGSAGGVVGPSGLRPGSTGGASSGDADAAARRGFYVWRYNATRRGECTHAWGWPSPNLLDHYRRHRWALFLPGQQDWSTTFQLLISLGAAVLAPRDMRSRTLWSAVLAERCGGGGDGGHGEGCTIGYNRSGVDVCASLSDAVASTSTTPSFSSSSLAHGAAMATAAAAADARDDPARRYAERLNSFVKAELNDNCVYAYMAEIWRGLFARAQPPHQPRAALLSSSASPPLRDGARDAGGHELQRLGFSAFDCATQRSLVRRLDPSSGGAAMRLGPYATWHFGAWFDASCARRRVPRPLPWAPCRSKEANPNGIEEPFALEWC